ncbi:hypothetical protein DPMN_066189 [Dreissena polymorpha]|uniref:HTH psq-type domain-containing protein n=1 Tax=Dreissena polymorpha TaxID=45954 RepID=A0A9D3YYH4_DREPO|nr:hypothetical protein DPMN_066189 [Dreissena polymorpha]
MRNHMSVQRAATSYGVPVTTLKDRVHGNFPLDNVQSGRTQLFSKDQKIMLVRHLNSMAEVCYGYSRQKLLTWHLTMRSTLASEIKITLSHPDGYSNC